MNISDIYLTTKFIDPDTDFTIDGENYGNYSNIPYHIILSQIDTVMILEDGMVTFITTKE